ncbi:NAD(P)-dependent oxidoreductase [Streptomyces sp. NRRL S-1813]|uniref:NAD(P)-dependent oxidoreductase n=1 Tax=Streptomyces sp. NRRL S-1813 TaxID=1463888 RepID=UPI0004CC2692|nr:NAD(P)-dependent oxidoreductase [Streptomyces sp. NRRL S-1813]
MDEAALLEALTSDRLPGALLDAYETEPLPPDSPPWRREDVPALPHRIRHSPYTRPRVNAAFASELRRRLRGQPLGDVVDLDAWH